LLVVRGAKSNCRQALALFLDESLDKLLAVEAERLQLGACCQG
jgi:hypothetical protein